jgi:hypothetical protein
MVPMFREIGALPGGPLRQQWADRICDVTGLDPNTASLVVSHVADGFTDDCHRQARIARAQCSRRPLTSVARVADHCQGADLRHAGRKQL